MFERVAPDPDIAENIYVYANVKVLCTLYVGVWYGVVLCSVISPCEKKGKPFIMTPPLVDLLQGHVTFFSLDVEGAEAMVLETVDFSKLSVDIWMVENVNNFCKEDCVSRQESHRLLQQAGYIGYAPIIMGSTLFVQPNSKYHQILERNWRFKKAELDII